MKQITKNSTFAIGLMLFVTASSHISGEEGQAAQASSAGLPETVVSLSQVGQKMGLFLKNNAFELISLACTLASLYMTYYYSHQSHVLNQASFVLDKGEVALKNIWMIPACLYGQYITSINRAKSQQIA